jgi:hypothetical protein
MTYGFYSETAAQQFGSFLYKMEDGSEQEITYLSQDESSLNYKFKDKQYIGIVLNYLRDGKVSKYKRGHHRISQNTRHLTNREPKDNYTAKRTWSRTINSEYLEYKIIERISNGITLQVCARFLHSELDNIDLINERRLIAIVLEDMKEDLSNRQNIVNWV